MATWRIVVKGRVQGVGFRAYVKRIADGIGVVGEVWNRTDGAVEALASASDDATLASLLDALHRGPGVPAVILRSDHPDLPDVTEFRIVPTR